MEEINRQRQHVKSQFSALHSQWSVLWDTLIELVKGQFNYIESGLRDLLNKHSGNQSERKLTRA